METCYETLFAVGVEWLFPPYFQTDVFIAAEETAIAELPWPQIRTFRANAPALVQEANRAKMVPDFSL